MTKIIDLDELTDNGRVHNLSGRPLGENSRNWAQIDTLDDQEETVTVKIPDHIYSISPSFFLGMFGASVIKFNGSEAFFNKYKFSGPKHVLQQIDQGADRAMLETLKDV